MNRKKKMFFFYLDKNPYAEKTEFFIFFLHSSSFSFGKKYHIFFCLYEIIIIMNQAFIDGVSDLDFIELYIHLHSHLRGSQI